MANQHVLQRLGGIRQGLIAAHQASSALSNSTKGREREEFIDGFLSKVLPPVYRFGSGDATDTAGNRSGQLDVVIEYPFSPTLPSLGTGQTRLYPAESIAAVIEVKSDLTLQWKEAVATAKRVSPLRRSFGSTMTMGQSPPTDRIPIFAVGYKGWANVDTAKKHIDAAEGIDGLLTIDPGVFVSSREFMGVTATSDHALWALISVLHMVTNSLQAASSNPISYIVE